MLKVSRLKAQKYNHKKQIGADHIACNVWLLCCTQTVVC